MCLALVNSPQPICLARRDGNFGRKPDILTFLGDVCRCPNIPYSPKSLKIACYSWAWCRRVAQTPIRDYNKDNTVGH